MNISTERITSAGALFSFVCCVVMGAVAIPVSPVWAIRPFQIADDADAEETGLWELEFGFVFERRRSTNLKQSVIDLPGEIDLDYGLPWNAEIGVDFRSQMQMGDASPTLIDPVSEFAIFYKQELTMWEFDNFKVQTASEIGVDFPTTRERRKTGKLALPVFFAVSLWDIYKTFDAHFLVEGEIEELAGQNDLKLSYATFIEYPLPFFPHLRVVAEYGTEQIEHEPRRHLLLGGIDWTNPFNIIRLTGGRDIEFDVAPFFWFTEGQSRMDWGLTAGFEWLWG